MILKERGWEGVADWIHLSQDREHGWLL